MWDTRLPAVYFIMGNQHLPCLPPRRGALCARQPKRITILPKGHVPESRTCLFVCIIANCLPGAPNLLSCPACRWRTNFRQNSAFGASTAKQGARSPETVSDKKSKLRTTNLKPGGAGDGKRRIWCYNFRGVRTLESQRKGTDHERQMDENSTAVYDHHARH